MESEILTEVTLRELVEFLHPREWLGFQAVVNRVDSIDSARKGSLTFNVGEYRGSDASVVICSEGAPRPGQAFLLVDNPRLAFIRVVRRFFNPEVEGIHPSAQINWLVVTMGERVRVGPGAVIGFSGFGYERNEEGAYEHFPHLGGVIIGDDVDIGSNTCIDRGVLGDTVICDGAKIDNLVHIAHNARIGKNCIIVAHSCIAGSARIEDGAWIAPHGCVRDGVTVGEGAMVGMGAVVTKDVEAYDVVVGVPAKSIKEKKG